MKLSEKEIALLLFYIKGGLTHLSALPQYQQSNITVIEQTRKTKKLINKLTIKYNKQVYKRS